MTRYRIEFTPAANRQFRALTPAVRRRIGGKIDLLGETPRPQGCVKLKGVEDIFRIRVGDYRVIYQVRDDVLLVLIVMVGNRREVYRRY